MPRMFGTDGVRGLANRDLTAQLALDLGDAAVRVLGDDERSEFESRRRALVGRDTRVSGDFLAAALSAGMSAGGFDVIDAGIIPTPGVAYLTSVLNVEMGAVISASHNPMPDNGIKFFARGGFKLPDTKEELEKALRGLLRYGGHVVVEKKIKGREIQIAVLGDTYLPAVEIIPRGAYFDYVSKYQKDGAEEICPAPITEEAWHQIGEMALTLHRGLGLSVYSRSDFILDADGNAWCLEVNTLPGMTPTSLVPQEAAQVGLSYADLCEKLVLDSLALRKAAQL